MTAPENVNNPCHVMIDGVGDDGVRIRVSTPIDREPIGAILSIDAAVEMFTEVLNQLPGSWRVKEEPDGPRLERMPVEQVEAVEPLVIFEFAGDVLVSLGAQPRLQILARSLPAQDFVRMAAKMLNACPHLWSVENGRLLVNESEVCRATSSERELAS